MFLYVSYMHIYIFKDETVRQTRSNNFRYQQGEQFIHAHDP